MENLSPFILFIMMITLILVSAFFSAAEIAMMALNRYRLRHMVREGDRAARRVSELLNKQDRVLSVILIGNTFSNILASAAATVLSVTYLNDYGVFTSTVILTIVVLVFAEIAPKIFASSQPLKLALRMSLPLRYLLSLFYPIVWLANTTARGLLYMLGVPLTVVSTQLTHDELHTVVRESSTRIPKQHRQMLLSVFELSEATVEDIMVPRSEIVGIDLEDDFDDILTQIESAQHTRMPLYSRHIEDVRGIIHLRDLLGPLLKKELDLKTLVALADDCFFVPEATPLSTVLLEFQKKKCRTGLVVDEYGELMGLITLEDILEEIVGDFTTDIATLHPEIYPQDDGSFYVEGSITIRDLNRSMSWRLPENGPKTLSGLIIENLEFIPPVGTCLKIEGYPIEVIYVHENMIKTARIMPVVKVDHV